MPTGPSISDLALTCISAAVFGCTPNRLLTVFLSHSVLQARERQRTRKVEMSVLSNTNS